MEEHIHDLYLYEINEYETKSLVYASYITVEDRPYWTRTAVGGGSALTGSSEPETPQQSTGNASLSVSKNMSEHTSLTRRKGRSKVSSRELDLLHAVYASAPHRAAEPEHRNSLWEGIYLHALEKCLSGSKSVDVFIMFQNAHDTACDFSFVMMRKLAEGKFGGRSRFSTWLYACWENFRNGTLEKQEEAHCRTRQFDELQDGSESEDEGSQTSQTEDFDQYSLREFMVREATALHSRDVLETASKIGAMHAAIAKCIAEGMSQKATATQLGVSTYIVARHLAVIGEKHIPAAKMEKAEAQKQSAAARLEIARKEREIKRLEREHEQQGIRERLAGVVTIGAAEDNEKYPSFAELAARAGVNLSKEVA